LNNIGMAIGTGHTVDSDLEALTRAIEAGSNKDPALLRRIQERAEAVRQRILKEKCLLNVAVDLVREGREE
jgi:hypothetical protein